MNKYVIITATYNRPNGKTSEYLNNSLNSIYEQKCENWDLILVGDKYEPYEELEKMVNDFKTKLAKNNKQNQVILIDNQEVERDHIKNKVRLWNCAGARSINKGLEYARNQGYKYYLHLDDDDFWYPNHIEIINKVYEQYDNCIFINTLSTYKNGFLPKENVDIYPNNLLPKPCGMIHSSFSFRIDIVPFYYYTSFNDSEIDSPSDANMLHNIREFLIKNKEYCSIYIPMLSCRHDIEGESLK
jgi:glycosyltransferase involved in cell wall biosynthesis